MITEEPDGDGETPRPALRPGAEIELPIDGLSHDGDGVGRAGRFPVFVPRAVPGDRVLARVVEVRRSFARADLVRVLAPSPTRTRPPCPVYDACGGCQLQHLAYGNALEAKRELVRSAIVRIAELPDVPVHPVLGMADPWRYRNKVQFPVGLVEGRLVAGPYARGSHEIVDVDDCLIQDPVANRILAALKAIATRHRLPPFDEARHEGELRHVLVRTSRKTGEALVVLVTRTDARFKLDAVARDLRLAAPEVAGVWQNVNGARTNVVLSDRSVHLAGKEAIEDEVLGLTFRISPASFFQVNPVQTEVLYSAVLDAAALSGGETAVDAYAGVGTITLLLAKKAAKVYGIESVREAVRDAEAAAERNGIANVEFLCGGAGEVLDRLRRSGLRPGVVVFDPPRKGCEPEALEAAARMAPSRMIQVSCNPKTLARDLALLRPLGYETLDVQPVDMFPHTAHVECVARLVRRA